MSVVSDPMRTELAGTSRDIDGRTHRGRLVPSPKSAYVACGAAAVALFALTACKQPSRCEKEGVAVEVGGEHSHVAEVPAEHVKRGVGGTYRVHGGADHEHAATLSDADLAKLVAGEAVATRATSVKGHTHEVSIKCK